jgi:large conductance mechanosensitive channel
VMMPPIGFVLGKMDFSKMSLKMEVPPVIPGDKPSVVEIMYGKFINVGIGFIITALCLFLIIKAMNAAKARFEKKKEVGAVEPPAQEKLLMEIRDLLKAKA